MEIGPAFQIFAIVTVRALHPWGSRVYEEREVRPMIGAEVRTIEMPKTEAPPFLVLLAKIIRKKEI